MVRVSIKLDRTLFPLTFIELTTSLEKLGFEISSELPFPRPRGRFIGTGNIARKGNFTIQIDAGSQAIGMIGPLLESTIDELDSFLNTLKRDYSVDFDEFAKYYQLVSHYEYKTVKNAYTKINDFFSHPKLDELSKIVEIPIKTFSFKVGLADVLPNGINWFDMQFSPDEKRNDGYAINIVYRNENRETYRNFISHIEEKIMKSIQLIEG